MNTNTNLPIPTKEIADAHPAQGSGRDPLQPPHRLDRLTAHHTSRPFRLSGFVSIAGDHRDGGFRLGFCSHWRPFKLWLASHDADADRGARRT